MHILGKEHPTGWSVRAQLVTIVLVVAVLLAGVGSWLAVLSLDDSAAQARRNTRFQANLAAQALGAALSQAKPELVSLAQGFPVAAVLADPSRCRLNALHLGVVRDGHIDIVLPDGRVLCSSTAREGAPAGANEAGAAWLRDPRTARQVQVTDLFTDRLSNRLSIAITAPIVSTPGTVDGFVAVVVPVDQFPATLGETYGGPQHYAFTVQTADGKTIAGTAPGKGRFITGQQSVPGLGWILTARQARSAALAGTKTAFFRIGLLVLASLLLLLVLLITVNRRIGHPLRRLTKAAAQAGQQGTTEPVPSSGPSELRRLADEFNAMIDARDTYERQLANHVLYDPLTGLPNRALCLDRIEQALQAAGETPASLAVLSVDIDRFKVINASLGYHHGNDVLIAIGNRLAGLLEPTDILARSGGDGFVICRRQAQSRHALEGLIANVMDRISSPMTVAETEITLTASVGVAYGRRGVTPEDLVRDADTAMYAAKEAGGGRYRLIDDELRTRSSERLTLEADLRTAILADQLYIEYQPVVSMANRQITGVEALLRWRHPTRGVVSPMTFIPVAEATGLIIRIGQFVLQEACRQAARWAATGHHLRVAVNVSGLQLHDPGFVAIVADALLENGLRPGQLCLELTETTLMDDRFRISEVLQELKDVGVELSVDDFGTGYSSLAYLQRFPVDELKVDQSFVRNLGVTRQDHTLVAAMVAMSQALGLHVTAEGVETETQLDILRDLGCDSAQGYLFSRPQPAAQITQLLTSPIHPTSS